MLCIFLLFRLLGLCTFKNQEWKKKKPKPFTPQKPQVICQKQVSEINYSFWFDEPLGKFLSSPSLTYSRTQNNHKPVRDVLSTLGSLCNFTAFDTVGDKPRGARNSNRAGEGLLLPTQWFTLASSLLLTAAQENATSSRRRLEELSRNTWCNYVKYLLPSQETFIFFLRLGT